MIFHTNGCVSFEYIVFAGINDSPAHVTALVRLLSGLKCRINLIRFHAIPDAPMQGADEATMIRMRDALARKGSSRPSARRGAKISAAWRLLSTREQEKQAE